MLSLDESEPDPTEGDGSTLVRRYSRDLRERAVAAVDERRLRNPRDRTIYREVAQGFGVGEQSLRLWVKKNDAERIENKRDREAQASPEPNGAGAISQADMEAELASLRKQIQKLRAENDVLKRAFVVFSSEWGRDET